LSKIMGIINGNYREFKLDNGLVVALQETPTQTIYGQLSVYYGTVHEKAGEEVLAHFLEHALATGTEKHSSEEMDEMTSKLGYFNLATSLDETVLIGDMLYDDLETYLEIISSSAFYPRLDEKRIEEERQRVLREMSNHKSQPTYADQEVLKIAVYGKEHPFCLEILGKESVINSATKQDLKNFHSRGYNAANMDLILVGALPRDTESLIAKYFKDKPAGENKKYKFPQKERLEKRIVMHTYAPDLYNKENPEESNAAVDLGIIVPPKTHEDVYNIILLSKILGGGPDSRLFRLISKEKGMAYSINADYNGDNNVGALQMGGRILSKRKEEAINLIFNEFKKLQDYELEKGELEREKKRAQYGLAKIFETNQGHLNAIRAKLEHGITPERFLAGIQSVTSCSLQEAAIKYLPESKDSDNYVLAIRDPLKFE
ncbi:MAG: pitrilysin family protein, partial [Nanoarchaeota archaeon]